MLKDGKYAAWFRTPLGQGTGMVHIADGVISGCDSFFSYGGSYEVDESSFTAKLRIRRHSEGPPSVFGLDEVELSLAGICKGAMATCSGTAERAPDLPLEVTLIYSREEQPPADATVVKLNTDRPPKAVDSRSRPRHPRVSGPSRAS